MSQTEAVARGRAQPEVSLGGNATSGMVQVKDECSRNKNQIHKGPSVEGQMALLKNSDADKEFLCLLRFTKLWGSRPRQA